MTKVKQSGKVSTGWVFACALGVALGAGATWTWHNTLRNAGDESSARKASALPLATAGNVNPSLTTKPLDANAPQSPTAERVAIAAPPVRRRNSSGPTPAVLKQGIAPAALPRRQYNGAAGLTADPAKLLNLARDLVEQGDDREKAYAYAIGASSGDIALIQHGIEAYANASATLQGALEGEFGRAAFAPDAEVQQLLDYVDNSSSALSRQLEAALIVSGNAQATLWLEEQLLSPAQARPSILAAMARIKAPAGELIPALINIASAAPTAERQLAAVNALGAIGQDEAYEYLMQAAGTDEVTRSRSVIALANAASTLAWSTLQDEMLFGEDVPRRLVALESYAMGFTVRDKAAVRGTLAKIAVGDGSFPVEMVTLATNLLAQQDASTTGIKQ